MANETTTLMGDYEILSVLGTGGMGRVYKVRNVITDRVEAMKVLLPDVAAQEEVAARFLREIKVLASLDHPNIAALRTALTINNQFVMIMEYVEGSTLSSRIAQGAIPAQDAINNIDQVLNALAYAHEKHIIHRDIKPANMVRTPEGIVKLMDFGIARSENEPAKLTAVGSTLGSVNYMSPEQVRGEGVDERSDLYSLGISLYEMVTGEKPFHGDSSFSIMSAHIQQAPRPPQELHPGLPAGLNEVILTAIAKSPDQRFQSAAAFRNALRSVQGSSSPTQVQVAAYNPATATTAVRTVLTTSASKLTASAAEPKLAPVPAVPQVANTNSARGTYIAIGALLVFAILAAAAVYVPKRGQTSAAPNPAPVSQEPATPQSSQPPQEEASGVSTAPTTEAVTSLSTRRPAPAVQSAETAEAERARAEAAAMAEALNAVEHDVDQLTSRAGGVNSSLDRLQQQQSAYGLGLRGDMAERQASMKLNLTKAQNAIQHQDLERAKRYARLAESDIETLEKFLGR